MKDLKTPDARATCDLIETPTPSANEGRGAELGGDPEMCGVTAVCESKLVNGLQWADLLQEQKANFPLTARTMHRLRPVLHGTLRLLVSSTRPTLLRRHRWYQCRVGAASPRPRAGFAGALHIRCNECTGIPRS